jgi:hypothetical protein
VDWGKLGAWIYQDGVPDYAKLARHNIGSLYVDPRSANAAQVLADATAHGYQAGLYIVAAWAPGMSGAHFAKYASDHLQRLTPWRYPEAPPCMLDLEGVSKDWTAECVTSYRTYQPRRPTSYTNEPWKDGTVVPTDVLKAAGLHWFVQLYYGSMAPADSAAAVLEVCRWGYNPTMVHPFYDGQRLPADARDGCVFTLERLP